MNDVATYLGDIEPPQRRAEAVEIARLIEDLVGEPPRMWGSIVGFGERHYRYASGREGDTFRVGFAARKPQIVLYLSDAIGDHADLLARLGPHTTGQGCLNIRRLDAIDRSVLAELIGRAWSRAD